MNERRGAAKKVIQEVPELQMEMEKILTHPDKIFWPKEGYSKRDLLEYYSSIAPYLLPHLQDRPIILYRFPDGIKGKGFFQKEAPLHIPDWMRTITVRHSNKQIHYLAISDERSLLYVANLGSIEIHPFLSRFPEIDLPDDLVLDLDPIDVPFDQVVEVAARIHSILNELKLDNYCKTSGKRGLHIYIPLHARYQYEIVENFSKLLAFHLHQQMSDLTSVIRDPEKRKKKVYLDYLQNARTKGVAAPYSVRAVEGALVSAPLEWKEVKKGLDPRQFTIKTLGKRLEKKGDLFKGVLGKGVDIENSIKRVNARKDL